MAQVRETLAGRYDLLEVIGRGGMGVVYQATDRVLHRSVAIKILPGDLASDPTFVARFRREALAAAALNHPNIVAIYDSGHDEDTRFIVMEYVHGQSLSRLLSDEGCLAPERAVGLATQIAAALAAAHRAGLIHRDIKPANVMVDEGSRVKVLDFGIARAAAHTTLTQHDVILGSAPYLAPEVANGLPADTRTDIYSLGCVLYAMLTGDPPFAGDLPAAIMHQHVTAPPRALSELGVAVPPGLEALVLRMLAKDPAERPQSAAELMDALPRALAGDTAATAPLRRQLDPATTRAQVLTPFPAADSRRLVVPLLGALVVAAIVAVIALAAGGGSTARSARRHVPAVRTVSHPTVTKHSSQPVRASVSTTKPASTSKPAGASPLTVADATRALGSLLYGDVRAGSVDQPAAAQILAALRDTLHAYEAGNSADALNHIGALPAQIAQLQSSGDVQAAAVAPLDAAAGQLQSALERATPQTPTTPGGPAGPADGGPPAGGPAGHVPPGQAKKHDGHPHGHDHGPAGGD